MKTAIVHDWLVNIGGAEKCLKEIYDIYPSDLFTLVFKEESAISLGIDDKRISSSFIQKLPNATENYRSYLYVFPTAVERFDVSNYEIIISSSHAVAKGVRSSSKQFHICYCYTPIRYAWDLRSQYLKEANLEKGIKGKLANIVLDYIKKWDYAVSNRVDEFIAISKYIADRIKRSYGREAKVIYPPVDTEAFTLGMVKEEFFLAASRMVPYKKMDLIVEAFSMMPDKKLVVIGNGPDLKKVKLKSAKNIEFLGYQPLEVLKDYMQKARAFVFAAEEDFGILPIEAQACGTPVIAYGKGGSLETIIEGKTGFFFEEQTIECLINSVNNFEKNEHIFDPQEIRKNAERFSRERFKIEFKEFVDDKVEEFYK